MISRPCIDCLNTGSFPCIHHRWLLDMPSFWICRNCGCHSFSAKRLPLEEQKECIAHENACRKQVRTIEMQWSQYKQDRLIAAERVCDTLAMLGIRCPFCDASFFESVQRHKDDCEWLVWYTIMRKHPILEVVK